jgi:hypothetical protein
MTSSLDPAIWDDAFHGASVAAYADLLAELGRPPRSEEHRVRSYAYYEEELARKNRQPVRAMQEVRIKDAWLIGRNSRASRMGPRC